MYSLPRRVSVIWVPSGVFASPKISHGFIDLRVPRARPRFTRDGGLTGAARVSYATAHGRGGATVAVKQRAGIHVALLRGVNVGGKNRLPMADLAAIFEKAGSTDVATLIQSGNVVFAADAALAARVADVVGKRIEERFGFACVVVVRTAQELAAAVRDNPFVAIGADEGTLHVMFLAHRPTPARVAALDAKRSTPDEFVVHGREVYLRLPNGVARTKLSNAYFDAKLATTSTVRNWRTVLKLLALTEP